MVVTLPYVAVPPKTLTAKQPSSQQMQTHTLKRGEKVRFVSDLPGLPQGTAGKVALANGFTWNRYWVRLQDGRVVGHIDHEHLIRSKDYERYLHAKTSEQQEAELAAQLAAEQADKQAAAESSDETSGSTAGKSTELVVNGVTVPAYLLQRSADARARLGA